MPKRTGLLLLLVIMLAACRGVEPTGKEQAALNPFAKPQATIISDAQQAPPTPSALPNDELLVLAADQRIAGEYGEQQITLQQVLDQQPSADQARAAKFGISESLLLQGRADEATQAFEVFLADGQNDERTARAIFLLARAHETAGRFGAAIATYERYRMLKTPIEPYAALRQAAQQRAAGQIDQAVATFEHVAQQPIGRARRAEALEALIEIYGTANRPDLQLARFRDLLNISQSPGYRPQVLWRAAQIAGATDESRGWLRELVAKYPERAEALDALALLEADPASGASPWDAANVRFKHEQYSAAVPLFDAALGGELAPDMRFEARRLRALALREQGLFSEALAELGALAQAQPLTSGTPQAELDYVQTVGWGGDNAWAIDGYRRFAARFPQHELAPEALWRAIQLVQRQGDQAGAMAAALELGRQYPASTQAHVALSQAGLFFAEHNAPDQAIEAWRLLGTGAVGADSAEGYYWAGTLLAQSQQPAAAQQQWQAASTTAPHSFYAMRARERLQQAPSGKIPLGSAPSAAEQAATADWIANWAGAAPADLADQVAQTPEVVRARELGLLDLRNEARDEWFAARDAANDDPQRLWQIALQASAADQPYVALKAAERIIQISPDKRITAQTPPGLLRLIYPTPYARVVQREAQNFGIDPRIVYAVLRQESLFNPDATSWVGARGLGQVMPSTGEGIAQNLQVANYSADLLYRPAVSIRFGTHYISHQLRSFNNDLIVAAAAYNGGPGNAARWLETTTDRDLFAELIDYRETRDYVKIVYGNYGMYQMLYGP